jgi:hypothetical protein
MASGVLLPGLWFPLNPKPSSLWRVPFLLNVAFGAERRGTEGRWSLWWGRGVHRQGWGLFISALQDRSWRRLACFFSHGRDSLPSYLPTSSTSFIPMP